MEESGERGRERDEQKRIGEEAESRTERERVTIRSEKRQKSTLFSTTIWAASEHSQEFQKHIGLYLFSIDDLLPLYDFG